MKRLFFAIVSMLIVAACANEDPVTPTPDPTPNPDAKLVQVEFCVEDSATRIDVDDNKVTWAVGDKMNVQFSGDTASYDAIFEITDASQILDDGKRAKFTGMVLEGTYTGAAAFYPGVQSGGDEYAVNEHAADNLYMGGIEMFADELVVAEGATPTLNMSLSHIMHKIDYKLSGDVNHANMAVEMVVVEGGNIKSLTQFGSYDMSTGTWSQKAATSAHFTGIMDHNFTSEPVASAMVFPFEAVNAELLFNVYIDGKKTYSIKKGPFDNFAMSAGKSSTISLELNDANKVGAGSNDTDGGSTPSVSTDFDADYYITTFKSGVSGISGSYGVGFRADVNGSYIDVHFSGNYATSSSIETGEYIWTSTTLFGYNAFKNEFTVRNPAGLAAVGLKEKISLDSGSAKVSKDANDNYYIDLTLTDEDGKTAKVQYIGKLNVENGGIIPDGTGGGSESSSSDIQLTTLTAKGAAANGCYTFAGVDAKGNTIDLLVNTKGATANTISRGLYEFTVNDYANNEGLFSADNIKLNGAMRSDVISGMMHVTAANGRNANLSVNLNFEDGTSQRYTFSNIITDESSADETITLSASKTTIMNDNSDAAVFTVLSSGSDVTSECTFYVDDEAISGNEFTSSVTGTYTVYAMMGDIKSNEIIITVKSQDTLTLSASKASIYANGADEVTFTVMLNGSTNVTSSSKIYVNGNAISGSTYRTNTAGSIRVHATYNDLTSNSVSVEVMADNSEYVVVFADGVTKDSGWYDVNKHGQGTNGDASMCWAGAASNMIQWWQDRYVEAGNELPAGAITGPGTKPMGEKAYVYELALMEMFYEEWQHIVTDGYGIAQSRGSQTYDAIPWYFEGRFLAQNGSAGSQAVPIGAGGYYKDIWNTIYPTLYHEYNYQFKWFTDLYVGIFQAYHGWDEEASGAAPLYGIESHRAFSQRIIEFIDRGIVSMTIAAGGANSHHATTVWGYELNQATGLVTKLWITDTDDMMNNPKTPRLNEYTVTHIDGKYNLRIESDGVWYGNAEVIELQPFSGYNSAGK